MAKEHMGTGRAYKGTAAVTLAMLVAGISILASGVAWGAPRLGAKLSSSKHIPHPILRFNDAAHQVQLVLPNPACPATHPGCVWMLRLDQPFTPGDPVVAVVTGTSGTLSVAYPAVCAMVQADALVGPAPWQPGKGIRRTFTSCPPGTVGATAAAPKAPTSLTSAALPYTSSAPPATTGDPAAGGAQLPFTGIDVRPLALVGMSLILAGLLLATTGDRRRRMRQDTLWWFLGR